jgi:hypothetical protein
MGLSSNCLWCGPNSAPVGEEVARGAKSAAESLRKGRPAGSWGAAAHRRQDSDEQRGIYDNMKTAVETILVGKDRLYNRRFLQMCSHYLVEPVACTPASGWEKGQVENQVGLVRERFFTPRLRFKNYDELNAWLLDKCIAYAKAHRHPELTEQTIWEVFEAERPKLVPYAGRFDGFHAVQASVSKTCLVRFDNNKYSVTANAVGRPVEVHAYADRIVIRQDGRIVAEHPRSFGRSDTVYDPWHYVPVLARKPGALRNGAPFKDWVLPAAMERVRRKLAGAAGSKEAELARIEKDERFRYFRVDSGKQNLAPPEKAKWGFLELIDLPSGDNVQVVTAWKFPEVVHAVTQEEIDFIRATAREGVYNRWDSRAKYWIGHALADWLGLDVKNMADRQDVQAKLNACRKSGVISVESRQDDKRRRREFVVPGPASGQNQGPAPEAGHGQGREEQR